MINEILENEFTIPILFVALFILGVFFLILQARNNNKMRTHLIKSLNQSQEKLFSNAAELLARKLIEYTGSTLTEKVNANYRQLTNEELLPAVNEAVRKTTELAELVVMRQETGMIEVAGQIASLLAEKTRDYIREEAAVVAELHQSTEQFSEQLHGITGTVELLSNRYEKVYEQASVLSNTLSDAVVQLTGKLTEFSEVLDGTARSVDEMQRGIIESNRTAGALSSAAEAIGKTANDSAVLLATQNEKTAALLADAVHSMQVNTENATRAVLEEVGSVLKNSGSSMENTMSELREITDKINQSAIYFADGLSSTYEQFGNTAGEKFTLLTKEISESSETEYRKIMESAENFSQRFTDSVTSLGGSLESHIVNLQTITRHLDNSVSSFKGDADNSSERFVLGIEKTVSETLKEMDSALAEIVKRLVSVTVSIEEAADALPKAVKAIKDN